MEIRRRHADGKGVARGLGRRLWATLRSTVTRFFDADGLTLAAALSFYAVLSLVPLLLVLGALAEHALGDSEALRGRLLGWAGSVGSAPMKAALEQALAGIVRRAPSPVVGVGVGAVAMVLGASAVFVELDAALKRIFGVPGVERGVRHALLQLLIGRLLAFLLVLATSVALLVSTVARGALELRGLLPGGAWGGSLVSLVFGGGLFTLGLALCYRFMPRPAVPWRAAFLGALLASALLHLLREPMAWCVGHLTAYTAYGLFGAVLAVLTWFQVAASLVLVGACAAASLSAAQPELP